MAQPQMAEAQHARTQIVALGDMLADVVGGRDVGEVHRLLLAAFDAPHDDGRIDAVEVGREEFSSLWAALRQGSDLPDEAWVKVVLPTVVVFSSSHSQKAHLGLATAAWLAARAAVDAVAGYPELVASSEHDVPPADEARDDDATPQRAEIVSPSSVAAAAVPAGRRPRAAQRRVLVAVVALAVIAGIAYAAGRREGARAPGPDAGSPRGSAAAVAIAGPSMEPSVLPTVLPSAAAPPPAITSQPPAPKPAGPGPSFPPSAPQGLTAVAATEDSVTLRWSAPVDAGTGGVAYYRILRDGSPAGWTPNLAVTVNQMTPGTRYIFVVVATNPAGQQSPVSGAVTVVTSAPPGQASAEPPAPSPQPSPDAPLPGTDVVALGGTVRITCSNKAPTVIRVEPAAGYVIQDVPQPKDQVRVLLTSPDNDSEITARCAPDDRVDATVREQKH